jgi:hypothetical protein
VHLYKHFSAPKAGYAYSIDWIFIAQKINIFTNHNGIIVFNFVAGVETEQHLIQENDFLLDSCQFFCSLLFVIWLLSLVLCTPIKLNSFTNNTPQNRNLRSLTLFSLNDLLQLDLAVYLVESVLAVSI